MARLRGVRSLPAPLVKQHDAQCADMLSACAELEQLLREHQGLPTNKSLLAFEVRAGGAAVWRLAGLMAKSLSASLGSSCFARDFGLYQTTCPKFAVAPRLPLLAITTSNPSPSAAACQRAGTEPRRTGPALAGGCH